MSDEQIRRIIADSYDDAKEETLLGIARDFYSRRMIPTIVVLYVWAIPLIALAVYSAIQFFKTDQPQRQIMYASLFIVGALYVGLMKILAWEMFNRQRFLREFKTLELRVAELSQALKSK